MNTTRRFILILALSLLCISCKVGIVTRDGLEVSIQPVEPAPSPAPTNSSPLSEALLDQATALPPTPQAETTRPGGSTEASAELSRGLTKVSSQAQGKTKTPAPAATNTPTLMPTATLHPAQISFIGVSTAEAGPGETVTLSWQASGDRATICPSTQELALFTDADCWSVPLAGTTEFTIPYEATPEHAFIKFMLIVQADGVPQHARSDVVVRIKCRFEWFFPDSPQSGACPLDPIASFAAAQHFERGTMIWVEQLGEYFILEQAPLFEGSTGKRDAHFYDPLDIIQDTSAEVQAPPQDLYAPQSGFGLVWRGDVNGSPGYRQALGWALAPEFGYEAVYQCNTGYKQPDTLWQFCYLKGPDDEIILFYPLGGWYLLPVTASESLLYVAPDGDCGGARPYL